MDVWERNEYKVEKVVKERLKKSEEKWREKGAVDRELDVAVDCRWSSRGFNAEEVTVLCCCLQTNKVIYHENLMRNQKEGIFSFFSFSFLFFSFFVFFVFLFFSFFCFFLFFCFSFFFLSK
jgi:hypothetical protein